MDKVLLAMIRRNKTLVQTPIGFDMSSFPAFNIFKDAIGGISTNFDASNYQHVGEGKTYYVNATGGSELNDGLTPQTAITRLNVARSKPDVDIIRVASGHYDIDLNFNGTTTVNKNITIKAAEGANVIISTFKSVTWSKTASYSNVYQASRTLVAAVFDDKVLDEFGDYTKLTSVASIEDVDTTPGSYFYATPNLYIHTPDSRPADTRIRVSLDAVLFHNVGNFKTYFEGLKLYGGNDGSVKVGASTSADNPLFVAKYCEFKYSSGGDGGIESTGADCYLQNCLTARHNADGNNYHKGNDRLSNAIEVNCISRRNGIGMGEFSDNATTMHDGGKIIRINGTYYNCEGPNVADIDAGTQSWNLGCVSHTSVCTQDASKTNYYIGNTGEMWLDSCFGYGSKYSYKSGAGILYARGTNFDNAPPYSGTLVHY